MSRQDLIEKRNQIWLVGGISVAVLLVLAFGAGYFLFRSKHARDKATPAVVRTTPSPPPPPAKTPHVYTCAELEPDHQAAIAETRASYLKALAAKGLTEANLEVVDIGGGPAQLENPEDVDKLVGRSAKAGEVIPYRRAGKRYQAYAGEMLRHDLQEEDSVELVGDGHGGIWQVRRSPHVRVVKTVDVDACQWGCWGTVPPGMPPPQGYHRRLWLLPEGATFRGNVTIEYDEPMLVAHPTQRDCPLPG